MADAASAAHVNGVVGIFELQAPPPARGTARMSAAVRAARMRAGGDHEPTQMATVVRMRSQPRPRCPLPLPQQRAQHLPQGDKRRSTVPS